VRTIGIANRLSPPRIVNPLWTQMPAAIRRWRTASHTITIERNETSKEHTPTATPSTSSNSSPCSQPPSPLLALFHPLSPAAAHLPHQDKPQISDTVGSISMPPPTRPENTIHSTISISRRHPPLRHTSRTRTEGVGAWIPRPRRVVPRYRILTPDTSTAHSSNSCLMRPARRDRPKPFAALAFPLRQEGRINTGIGGDVRRCYIACPPPAPLKREPGEATPRACANAKKAQTRGVARRAWAGFGRCACDTCKPCETVGVEGIKVN
jgi:hypothetical protein